MAESTGQNLYPAIQFEDGSRYREESVDMERTIRAGRLGEHRGQSAPPEPAPRGRLRAIPDGVTASARPATDGAEP